MRIVELFFRGCERYFGNRCAYGRFLCAEAISRVLYPKYKFSDYGIIWREDREFLDYYRRYVSRADFHSLDRKYTLDQLVMLAEGIEGDTAECGVYRGASSFLICRRTLGTGKLHHLFDSFEGISEPSNADGDWWRKGDLRAGEAKCKGALSSFGHVQYHKGWIPEKFSEVADCRFSFIHVDVDLYEPTRDTLAFFYPRLNRGGILLLDDHGSKACPGARRAAEEFFAGKKEKIISLTTGQAFILKG